MANIGITLGGFSEGFNNARQIRQRQQQIDLNKKRIELDEQNSLMEQVQSNVSQLTKRSEELTKFALENASILNQTDEGKKVLRDTLAAAKAANEKAGQLGAKAGFQVPSFDAQLQAVRQIAESTPTPEQQRQTEVELEGDKAEARAEAASRFRQPANLQRAGVGVTPDGQKINVVFDPDARGGNAFLNAETGDPIPSGTTVVEVRGDPASLDDLTSEDIKTLKAQEAATVDLVNTANDAIALLNESPSINTFSARAASFVNNMQQEAAAIAQSLDLEFDSSSLDPSTYENTFDELGIQNAQLRGLVTALAFKSAAASGQTGRAVSDKDVERFIQQTGLSESDPRAIARTLQDMVNRQVRSFKTEFKSRVGEEFSGELPTVGEFVDLPEKPEDLVGFDEKTEEEQELIRQWFNEQKANQ